MTYGEYIFDYLGYVTFHQPLSHHLGCGWLLYACACSMLVGFLLHADLGFGIWCLFMASSGKYLVYI